MGNRRESLRTAFELLHQRGERLIRQLWNGLREIHGVRLYGPNVGGHRPPLQRGAARTPTIAFTVNEMPAIEVAKKLTECGVFLSHGDFYAMTVVERLGQSSAGLVRAGCACYTTAEEVDRLIAGVRAL
jgi:selenocysteine lyase/cysteine desulfurase